MTTHGGDILIQKLWHKALQARGLEAIIFWPEYSLAHDAMLDWIAITDDNQWEKFRRNYE